MHQYGAHTCMSHMYRCERARVSSYWIRHVQIQYWKQTLARFLNFQLQFEVDGTYQGAFDGLACYSFGLWHQSHLLITCSILAHV